MIIEQQVDAYGEEITLPCIQIEHAGVVCIGVDWLNISNKTLAADTLVSLKFR